MSIENIIRQQVRTVLLQERIKIKDVTKNPPGSKHAVTVFAELSPISHAQLDTSQDPFEIESAREALSDIAYYPDIVHDDLKKDIIIQGDFIENSEGQKTLRLKLYDEQIPSPYKRPPGWRPVTLLTKLRDLNVDELTPYDEGGSMHDTLQPTPPEIEVPKAPKRPETDSSSTSRKRRSKRTTPSAIPGVETASIISIPLTNEEKGKLLFLLQIAMQEAMSKQLSIIFAELKLFVEKISKPITNTEETAIFRQIAMFLQKPEVTNNTKIKTSVTTVLKTLVNIKAKNTNT